MSNRKFLISFLFLLKTLIVGTRKNRLSKAVEPPQFSLTSTHNLCFGAKKKREKVYPCKPQFYYIKVGCNGVFVTGTCFRDGKILQRTQFTCAR